MQERLTNEQRRRREEYIDSLTTGRKLFRVSELLHMKPSFQRTLSPQQVAKMVAEWHVHRFDDPVVVICSDGTHLLDDGQHRVAAAGEVMGLSAEILCRVAHTDMPGREFVKLNTDRRTVSSYWKFAALLSDKDDTAVGITALAGRHGFSIGNSSTAPRVINCIGTVTALYTADEQILDRALAILSQVITKRENEKGWLRANVVQAVCYVIRHYDVHDHIFVRGLVKYTPDRAAPRAGNEPVRNAPDMIAAYNGGCRGGNRIEITDRKRG